MGKIDQYIIIKRNKAQNVCIFLEMCSVAFHPLSLRHNWRFIYWANRAHQDYFAQTKSKPSQSAFLPAPNSYHTNWSVILYLSNPKQFCMIGIKFATHRHPARMQIIHLTAFQSPPLHLFIERHLLAMATIDDAVNSEPGAVVSRFSQYFNDVLNRKHRKPKHL